MRRHYRELEVWKRGMDFAVRLYRVTAKLPPDERFGLVSDMRRAGISVPKNVAEGWGRPTARDYAHFVDIAIASTCELDTQLEICKRLAFLDEKLHLELDDERRQIFAMLLGLKRSLRL